MAALFDCAVANIGQHLKAVFDFEELAQESTIKGFLIVVADAKNYLSADELRSLNEIVSMYLDYATRQAKRGDYRGIMLDTAERSYSERIPGSELFLYEGLGYGLYEEAPDFLSRVAAFCRNCDARIQ